MATPPSRFSTPSGTPHSARSGPKVPRSASYAPASSASPAAQSNGQNGASSDEFLSPVTKFNRSVDHARQEQAARMKAIESERAHRLATKPTTLRLSGGSSLSQSSVKRKLTELEAAAQAAQLQTPAANAPLSRMSEPAKKVRTASPPRRPSTATKSASTSASANRRGLSYGGAHTAAPPTSSPSVRHSLSAASLKRHGDHHTRGEFTRDHVSAANAPDAQDRYLAYEHQQVSPLAPARADHATPPRSSHRASTAEAHSLFSRHNVRVWSRLGRLTMHSIE
jgi:hypothetical protein